MAVLAYRRALGAVAAHVERRVEVRFLAGPDAVLDFGDDAAAHRAVGADRLADFRLDAGVDPRGVCAPDHGRGQGRCHGGAAESEARATQERAPVHGAAEHAARCAGLFGGGEISLLDQLHR